MMGSVAPRARAASGAGCLRALAWLSAPGRPVDATDDLCGATIVANLRLDHDLTCVGAGLIAGADGITINLNGHTIKENEFTGDRVGILVFAGVDDVLKDNAGSAVGHTLRENRLVLNECGLKGPTDGNTLQGNVLEGNVIDSCQ